MTTTRLRLSLTGLTCSGVLLLSGCIAAPFIPLADPQGPVTSQGPTESTSPLAPEDDQSSVEPTDEPSSEEDLTLHFGDTVRYDDGLEITVSRPKKFKPSEYSVYPKDADLYIKFTVTVKNGTNKRIDPSSISTSATSGDEEMEEVFDTENNIDGAPQTKILKGKSTKYQIAYGALKGKDFILEVSPYCLDTDCEQNYESALFVS